MAGKRYKYFRSCRPAIKISAVVHSYARPHIPSILQMRFYLNARALHVAGVNVVGAAVLAATPQKLSENYQLKQVTDEGVWD